MPREPLQFKNCTKCGILKPRSDFYKKTETTIQPQCKPCSLESNKELAKKNREKYKNHRREYYLKNKEVIIQKVKVWNKNHPKQRSKYMIVVNAVRRGRKKNNGGFTSKEWQSLILKNNSCCFYCGKNEKMTIDHFIPLSKGGSNYITNIVPACKSCNTAKGSLMPDIFIKLKNKCLQKNN